MKLTPGCYYKKLEFSSKQTIKIRFCQKHFTRKEHFKIYYYIKKKVDFIDKHLFFFVIIVQLFYLFFSKLQYLVLDKF